VATQRLTFEDQIARNKRQTVLVELLMLVLLGVVILAVGALLGLDIYLTAALALIFAGIYIAISYANATRTVLHATEALPVNPNVREEKLLQYRVEEMALAAGLPVPQVYIQDSHDINAFATGLTPDKAIICVTRGALDKLSQEELEGVIGHEMSHVANYDVRLATVTVGVVGAIAILAEVGIRLLWVGGGRRGGRERGGAGPVLLLVAVLGLVLAPLLSRLVYLMLSRRREYLADATGAKLTRDPEGLASALEKIEKEVPQDPRGSRTVAGLYIANPWKHFERNNVWSTHPPLDERIRRLREM
jgi:heat shock protein HtpX